MVDATRPHGLTTRRLPNGGPVEPPLEYDWTARWAARPVGVCVRCQDPAHTLGPDGRPWHAFCYYAPNLPAPSTGGPK